MYIYRAPFDEEISNHPLCIGSENDKGSASRAGPVRWGYEIQIPAKAKTLHSTA